MTQSTNHIDVKIFGMTYKFASDSGNRKDILEYAYYLETLLKNESQKHNSAGLDKLLILVSLNLVESYFLENKKSKHLLKEIEDLNSLLESQLED